MMQNFRKVTGIILATIICVVSQIQQVNAVEPSTTASLETIEENVITAPEKALDWDALTLQNPDIYAWIYIPGTNIDYPMLQHPTDANYYIEHNIDGTTGYPGCISTQYYNSKTFNDPNTIVYGHNMKNGSMFRTLHYYEDETFFEENPYVYIYTPDATYIYEIFATTTVSNKHLMKVYNFWDIKGFNSFVSNVCSTKGKYSYVREGSEPIYGDYLLTLSTCNGNSSKRWLVVAKRISAT